MLIIYCVKNVSLTKLPYGIPEVISIITVAFLHIWKRNNLISILGGTATYMILIQFVF
jgi:branched-subunit amino acid transport protein AzlD